MVLQSCFFLENYLEINRKRSRPAKNFWFFRTKVVFFCACFSPGRLRVYLVIEIIINGSFQMGFEMLLFSLLFDKTTWIFVALCCLIFVFMYWCRKRGVSHKVDFKKCETSWFVSIASIFMSAVAIHFR